MRKLSNKNRLTFIEYTGERDKSTRKAKYQCSCGKTHVANSYVVGYVSGVLSCGCLQKEKASEAKSLPGDEGIFGHLYHKYKVSAEKRNLGFELDKKQVRQITKSDCFYCGSEPTKILSKVGYRTNYIYNGIDRRDNDIGYTSKNCVACCEKCNRFKWMWAEKDFIDHVARINAYQNKARR